MSESRFAKPIRDAVDRWARTFNAPELSAQILIRYRMELDSEVAERTKELEARCIDAEARLESANTIASEATARCLSMSAEVIKLREEFNEKHKALTKKYMDLEVSHSAMMHSVVHAPSVTR